MVKLGARVTNYYQNFYGELDDGINAGEQSDRVLVRWQVSATGEPQPCEVVAEREGDIVIATPNDIELIRKTNKAEAQTWRASQRATFEEAVSDGYSVRGLNAEYSYVLSRS
jgi:predicted GNAT superfamily acetyltransferase